MNRRRRAQYREAVDAQPIMVSDSDSGSQPHPPDDDIAPFRPRMFRIARPWWDCIPLILARQWTSPTWTKVCPFCNARLLTTETSRFCCNNGERTTQIDQLPELPNQMRMLLYDVRASSVISRTSRKLNNIFAFTAIGFTGHHRNVPYNSHVAISGRAYHRMLHMDEGAHSIRWYMYDESERDQQGAELHVDDQWLSHTRAALENVNPYVGHLRSFASNDNSDYRILELRQPTAAGEFAAIAHVANSTRIQPRSILIWRDTDSDPSFINPLSPHYEPLQYPVLFPHGTLGWGVIENDDGSQSRTLNLTQTQYYRYRLLTESRFLTFGRLTNEYICDMFSRVEDEKLNYIYRGRSQQFRDRNPQTQEDEDSHFDVRLPASFLGSREWISEETADSLALAREYGRGTFLMTMTTNPHWPEIESMLRPGQSAADVPIVVARAFKARLDHALKLINTKFGRLVYIVRVIEFQKRGFPHAHIIAKVCSVTSYIILIMSDNSITLP